MPGVHRPASLLQASERPCLEKEKNKKQKKKKERKKNVCL
jgi:hypothetical protein